MKLRQRIFNKLAQSNNYQAWAEGEIQQLKLNFPNVSLKSFSEFEGFLNSILPKLIHKYMLSTLSMKVCSGISPDFAEIAASRGFAVLVEKIPGHVRNILLASDGPYIIDLSYIQFLCKHDLSNKQERDQAIQSYKELYQNPFKAIKVEKMPESSIPMASRPTGDYQNQLYNPIESIEQYDPEETEETFPERFKLMKENK